ncbi:citrin NDAI_0B02420 [Naumovozyma dairenensis CBS 421]|uniref:Mitochondrial aspartate-glutamate transporter AGC1 n=1 Tax=Naumovozyma dairenensis (strain ATCC 10597 / BCRC 20456 / CBS 421 / NBRC 0211 / NRRL Y-12639) TaxID=1071378 RepID=G0W666_NAUDC|nr:hypothetical protein NDAI_0B02420 [Naumovozyma dairenensis CBS 421]CCD23277.1 hypothetical protein NDAI_0B02420 [Naumovozyma dairenensis CBS 421]
MEQINSNNSKRLKQIEIFNKYASFIDFQKEKESKDFRKVQHAHKGTKNGQFVLFYDDFINLITNSKNDNTNAFNLNLIPKESFGCIFLAMDENNKSYLTLNDWFYFNNILQCNNYQFLILYEFLRKFDTNINTNIPSKSSRKNKFINYSNKFLSFDQLLLNLKNLKFTINLLHETVVNDEFLKQKNLYLNWDHFKFLKFYQFFPYRNSNDATDDITKRNQPYLTLNSLITILQNDLKQEKLFLGFEKLARFDSEKNALTINRYQLSYLLKLFYSHKVSSYIFDSLDLSNTKLIKSNNNSITFNVFKDILYLFQNFDIINQLLIKYSKTIPQNKNATLEQKQQQIITKNDFITFLNSEHNKINNVIQFSPSQINLLFSIVENFKKIFIIINILINSFKLNQLIHKIKTIISYMKNLMNIIMINQIILFKILIFFNTTTANDTYPYYFLSNNELTIDDFMKIVNPNYLNDLIHQLELNNLIDQSLYINYYFYPIFDSIFNFSLGSIAGCIGATIVYPIDFIKTRMQAQRSLTKYKNSVDCLIKIVSKNGIRSLYSGLTPQLIGVAPEKAIKLTINDLMRNKLSGRNNRGNLKLSYEILSGATAGLCQTIVTNPLEIIKIRLQVKSSNSEINAWKIIKHLKFNGLYKGITACLLRDVPFSAIYFPTYAHLKKDLFKFDPNDKFKKKRLKTWELLTAGAIAGMPAAFLTTPFDVIKTRLQIEPKPGEVAYKGIFHAFKTIFEEESFKSFFKGGGARVLRSSPQFGFTLAAYEIFKNLFQGQSIDTGIDTGTGSGNLNDNPSLQSAKSNNVSPITGPFNSYFKSLDNSSYTSKENKELHTNNDKLRRKANTSNNNRQYYSDNYYPNYYYKSCQISKTFIDLDNNFAHFDYSVYKKFRDYLNSLNN